VHLLFRALISEAPMYSIFYLREGMTMQEDKRSSSRRNVALDICINNHFLDPRRWRTRDLGMDSAFVSMHQDEMLPGAHVDVVLSLSNTPGSECVHLSAEIIRVAKDGIALRFQDYDSHICEMLTRLLSDWREQPPARAAGQKI
jgi:hypothetical protein